MRVIGVGGCALWVGWCRRYFWEKPECVLFHLFELCVFN